MKRKLKLNLHNFSSAARAVLTVGGVASVLHPGAAPIAAGLGGVSVGIAVAWSQINAMLHPHNPNAAADAEDIAAIRNAVANGPFGGAL